MSDAKRSRAGEREDDLVARVVGPIASADTLRTTPDGREFELLPGVQLDVTELRELGGGVAEVSVGRRDDAILVRVFDRADSPACKIVRSQVLQHRGRGGNVVVRKDGTDVGKIVGECVNRLFVTSEVECKSSEVVARELQDPCASDFETLFREVGVHIDRARIECRDESLRLCIKLVRAS
jgi:hypothetical protein